MRDGAKARENLGALQVALSAANGRSSRFSTLEVPTTSP